MALYVCLSVHGVSSRTFGLLLLLFQEGSYYSRKFLLFKKVLITQEGSYYSGGSCCYFGLFRALQ